MKKLFERIKNIKLTKKVLIIIVGIWVLAVVTIGSTFGRFILDEVKDFFFSTQKFYFNSDKLGETLARYQVENWNGVDPYSITINMDSLENNLVAAETDIEYDISFDCSTNVICDSTKNSGVIYSASNTDYFIVTLTPNTVLNDEDSAWINITATSTDPYEKTLSGRFVLNVGYYGLSYEITDNPNDVYMELRITNSLDYYNVETAFGTYQVGDRIDISTYLALSDVDKDKCYSARVVLDFDPTEVLFDITSETYLKGLTQSSEIIDGYDYTNHIEFKIDAISSQVIRFFKADKTLDYTYNGIDGGTTSIIDVVFE